METHFGGTVEKALAALDWRRVCIDERSQIDEMNWIIGQSGYECTMMRMRMRIINAFTPYLLRSTIGKEEIIRFDIGMD